MDSIADMITSINNAQAVAKKQISVPYSNFKFEILNLLKKEGYILDVQKKGKTPQQKILIDLKYKEGDVPFFTKIRKVSKQGQKIYSAAKELRPVKSGHGVSIISTSKGLMTNKEARKNNAGGEIICEIW